MKSTLHILSSLALAAVGASMAQAQAYSYAVGYSAIGWSGNGIQETYSSGVYNYYGYYAGGNASTSLGVYSDGATYLESYGSSYAGANYGYGISELESFMEVGLTNTSNYGTTLNLYALTESVTESLAYGPNCESYSYSWGEVYDSAGNFQYSLSDAYANTFTPGAEYVGYYQYNYSNGQYLNFYSGNASGGYIGAIGETAYEGLYSIYLGAGATDYVVLGDYQYNYAYNSQPSTSSVPGPAAVAPFAVGLLGALRRRRKG